MHVLCALKVAGYHAAISYVRISCARIVMSHLLAVSKQFTFSQNKARHKLFAGLKVQKCFLYFHAGLIEAFLEIPFTCQIL